VAGKLSSGTSSLLSVVQDKIEASLAAHKQNHGPRPPGWKRPFLETASAKRDPIAKTIKDTVEFPEQDESVGELILNFIGPPRNDYLTLTVHILPLLFVFQNTNDRSEGSGHPWHLSNVFICCPVDEGIR
jgi:Zn-dependent M16 (insulinase) family peptidase